MFIIANCKDQSLFNFHANIFKDMRSHLSKINSDEVNIRAYNYVF